MATTYWLGRAKAVAQVTTATPGGTIGTETFTLTINGKSITYTATGGDTVANVVDGLLAAWQVADNDFEEFDEITPSDTTTELTLTGKTKGYPFTVSGSASGAATLVVATSTAATGPNHWNDANNWSNAAVPVNGDDAIVDKPISIKYGFAQSAVTLASLTITGNFGDGGGEIGLLDYNGTYTEYRATELAISATVVSIGTSGVRGSSMIKLNTGSNQTAITVYSTGSAAERGYGAFQWQGTHASNTLEVQSGDVGVAMHEGDTATSTTIVSGGRVKFGTGVTHSGTFTFSEGDLLVQSALATFTQHGGTATHTDGAITALNVYAGTFYAQSDDTCTAATVGGRLSPAVLDCSQDSTARTFTDLTIDSNGRLNDPNQTVTVTNNYQLGSGVVEISAR